MKNISFFDDSDDGDCDELQKPDLEVLKNGDGGGALVWLVLIHCGACVNVLCAPACVGHLLDVRLYDGDLLLLPRMCLLAVRVLRFFANAALCGSCFDQCRRIHDPLHIEC